MGGDKEALPIGREVGEEVDHGVCAGPVQIGRRLVHEEQGRVVEERPGDGDALALAARELAREVGATGAEADIGEERPGPPPAALPPDPGAAPAGRRSRRP